MTDIPVVFGANRLKYGQCAESSPFPTPNSPFNSSARDLGSDLSEDNPTGEDDQARIEKVPMRYSAIINVRDLHLVLPLINPFPFS
jgi:hypothetical protein